MKINLIITLVLAVTFFACSSDVKEKEDAKTVGHKVEVQEVIQANAYTYLRVTEDDSEYWMAINKNPNLEEGVTLYYKEGLEMKNFESRDLSRTFETIYFVQQVSNEPIVENETAGMQGQKPVLVKQDVDVEPVAGGVTISEIYSNRDSYSEKTVKVKGKVMKFNSGIMGRNWVHIQDGTSSGDYFDLTVTTQDQVKIGDEVVFEGVIVLNQDFGAGYSYEVLMEDSKVVK